MDTILYCIWPSRCSHCWEHLHKFLILLQYVLILETNFIIPILFVFFSSTLQLDQSSQAAPISPPRGSL